MNKLVSDDGRFETVQQGDGNLVTYDHATGAVVWDSQSGHWRQPNLSVPWTPPTPEPEPEPVPLPPGPATDKRIVRANFCNLTDSLRRPIFSSCLAAQSPVMQAEWLALEKAAGGTHYVFSIQTGYREMYPEEVNFYTAGRMSEWLATLDRVLAAGLVPVVMLDSGDPPYPGTDYLRSLVRSIPVSYYTQVIWCCGWETVAGLWTSREYYDGNRALRQTLGPDALLACHLSPGRLSFASNPVEADDPWGGDEMSCWRDHWGPSGHPFDVFLYQSPVPRTPFNPQESESWGERAKEVADRLLGLPGAPDWFAGIKRPTAIWFEATAFSFIRDESTSEYAREVARIAKTLGYQGFGNGLP